MTLEQYDILQVIIHNSYICNELFLSAPGNKKNVDATHLIVNTESTMENINKVDE